MSSNLNKISIALLLFVGAALGAGTMQLIEQINRPNFESGYISYDRNGETIFSLGSGGKMTLGPKYDRRTEAKKLVDYAKRLASKDYVSDCHETGYHSDYWSLPNGGMMQVYPGTAMPPPPRLEWKF
jgi:hypothetical protein